MHKKDIENISIIIITLNEEATISRLLQCLHKQTLQHFEVIIVDSDSNDNTEKIAKQHAHMFKAFTFHNMKKRGASLGRNTGATLAQFERIVFLDADTMFAENFLEKTTQYIQKHNIDIASCYIKQPHNKPIYTLGYGLINIGFFITQFFSPTAVGACIFSTKTIHTTITGFDENIYLCEDCDYVNRAQKHGKFRMIPHFFIFDDRRMEHDGIARTAIKYLQANMVRFLAKKELTKDTCTISYKFGHYDEPKNGDTN